MGFEFRRKTRQQPSLMTNAEEASPESFWSQENPYQESTMSRVNSGVQGFGDFMGKNNGGMANGIAAAGTAVGQASDPEGTGMGPALSGAAQGAATGTMIAPGYGTAIGAAIGLGLGLMQADNKRKQKREAADLKAKEIMAEGLDRAAQRGKVELRFGTSNRRGTKF